MITLKKEHIHAHIYYDHTRNTQLTMQRKLSRFLQSAGESVWNGFYLQSPLFGLYLQHKMQEFNLQFILHQVIVKISYLATGSGVALGLGDGTGETLLLLGLSECKEPVDW